MAERVIILGGGVGGLSAAHELAERGFEVEIHEPKGVPGGKARSIYVTGTGTDGRPDLPGEHGFRFFPGFYKHLPDTMKRIPFAGKPNGVLDGLVQATEYLLDAAPDKEPVLLTKYPGTPDEWRTAIAELFDLGKLGLPAEELRFFVDRLLVILTSCEDRRLAEYEKISWWDFIAADRMSDAYQLYLARGLTRSLVAMRAEEGSARTVGDILIQLLSSLLSPFDKFDRVLDGPTSEVWLDPWLHHLTAMGVTFHFGSTATSFQVAGGRITGAVVRDSAGAERVVTGDHYVAAMPVERLAALVSPEMVALDPALAGLAELRVAWMNGFQVFLREDVPMVKGHANHVASPWALTSISQAQFWPGGLARYGDGTVRGCLSIDISDWDTPGIVLGQPASQVPTRADIATEVITQLRGALDPVRAKVVADTNVHSWFLDSDIVLPNPAGATVNLEPLLVNTVDSWRSRPEAAGAIENLFIAADFARTYTDLATMEGANEAARRAVNSILARSGSRSPPCHVWPLEEPLVFLPFREYDLLRFKLGLPHANAEAAPPPPVPAPPATQAPAPAGMAPEARAALSPARRRITHRIADILSAPPPGSPPGKAVTS